MIDVHRRLVAACWLELRLTGRRWGYLAVLLLWTGLFAYQTRIQQDPLTAAGALHADLSLITFAATTFLALLLGAISATRNRDARIFALTEALPTGAEILVGRWLAVTMLALPVGFPLLIFALSIGPWESFWPAAPVFLVELLVASATFSALGYWYGDRLAHRRWSYPLLVIGWLACSALLAPGVSVERGFVVFGLLDVMRWDALRYGEIRGRLLVWELLGWLDLFHLGLAILLITLAALGSQACRLRRPRRASLLIAVTAAALILASSYGYVSRQHVLAAEARAADVRHLPTCSQPLPYDPRKTAPTAIDAWEVHADLSNPAAPAFTTQLTLRNAGDAPRAEFLTLFNEDVVIDEASVPFRRCGNWLVLALPTLLQPNETATVRLTYRGPLFTVAWRHTACGQAMSDFVRNVTTGFTRPDGVLLTSTSGWYPLPAAAHPDFPFRRPPPSKPGTATHASPTFRLIVERPAGFGILSNLPPAGPDAFAGGAELVALIASPRLAMEQHGDVTVVAPEVLFPEPAARLAADLQAMSAHLHHFLPAVEPRGITLAMVDDQGCTDLDPPLWSRVVVTPRAFPLGYEPGPHAYVTLAQHLSDDSSASSTSENATDNMGGIHDFLAAHYASNGQPERLPELLPDTFINEIGQREPSHPIALALRDAYLAHGEAAVIRVLERLFEEETVLSTHSPEELANWIREAAND